MGNTQTNEVLQSHVSEVSPSYSNAMMLHHRQQQLSAYYHPSSGQSPIAIPNGTMIAADQVWIPEGTFQNLLSATVSCETLDKHHHSSSMYAAF